MQAAPGSVLGLRAQTRPRGWVVDPAAWFRHIGLCPGVPGRCGGRDAARRGAVPTVGGGGETGSQTSAPGCPPASLLLLPGVGDGALSRRWKWQLKTPRVKCPTRVTRVSVEDEQKAVKASRLSEDFWFLSLCGDHTCEISVFTADVILLVCTRWKFVCARC